MSILGMMEMDTNERCLDVVSSELSSQSEFLWACLIAHQFNAQSYSGTMSSMLMRTLVIISHRLNSSGDRQIEVCCTSL